MPSWKHDAVNKLSVIYGYIHMLHRDAMAHIKDDMAIDVRDLCQDLTHKIDMFERNNVQIRRFIQNQQ